MELRLESLEASIRMQKMKERDWKDFGFVLASSYRKNIMKILKDGPRTPKELSNETKIYFSHVSITLKELSDKKLIKTLNPLARKGKFYNLTNKGKEIAENLK